MQSQDSGFVLAIYSKTQKIQINFNIHIQIPTVLTHTIQIDGALNNLSSLLQTHKILGEMLVSQTIYM